MNTENPLLNQLSLIDISNIEGVRFFQNGWQTFSVSLDSIKRIAVYIEKKYGKTTFLPWELIIESDYFVENYRTSLSKEDYKVVVDTLTGWIESWGGFEVIYRKNTWLSWNYRLDPTQKNKKALWISNTILYGLYWVISMICIYLLITAGPRLLISIPFFWLLLIFEVNIFSDLPQYNTIKQLSVTLVFLIILIQIIRMYIRYLENRVTKFYIIKFIFQFFCGCVLLFLLCS